MELIKGGTLKDLIKLRNLKEIPFTETECQKIILAITDALAYIHQKDIVHRDIKPENILIKDMQNFRSLKVADFGLSA